ncbi:hypothetical protein [Fluviispira multicolorata]|uniref:Uncharacterized protein n=1 Tax=Fluviispira multicolorata TaxID=2654512 RepID=A0A833JEM5_9BACT|nr:hypothetical protein [Fluviispira multicolorata]KAB8033284.1 hypothetical protein GCL57_00890 [Fluviispira multicolorata]
MYKICLFIVTLNFFHINAFSNEKNNKCSICEIQCGKSFSRKYKWTAAEIKLEMSDNKHLIFERNGGFILKLYKDTDIMAIRKETLISTADMLEKQNENSFYTVKNFFNFSYKGQNIFRIGCYCCAECGKRCE